MSDNDDELSFNPHEWRTGASASTARGAEPSFDPRTWVSTIPPPPSRPTAIAAPRDPQIMPAALSIVILAAGALGAWSARPAADGPAPAVLAPSVQPPPVGARRTLILASAGDIGASLAAAGIAADDAAGATRAAAAALGRDGGTIRLSFAIDGTRLVMLEATHDDGSGVVLTRAGDGGLSARRTNARLSTRLEIVRGEMDAQSFYSSAVSAGINDRLVGSFANAFAFDFDMQREVGPGDIFEAGFEQRYNPSGDAVGAPVLVYASLVTAAKSRALYRFTAPGGAEADWYDSNGRSTKRALMRTPVDSARISSQFGPRSHPILGFVKMHRGTDFAAPTGTPIFAAGDATVAFAGPKGANGNFVRLIHDNGWATLYLHMNRIGAGIAPGLRVVQGQQIGEVGTTGRSTGPHLHYEVHIGGAPVDPLGIDTGSGRSLAGAALAGFRRQRDRVDARRAAAG